ncbi:YhgE/Pip domain-containing protein [Sanguibacter inulinus]|uniref:YhgE/Pip domain-containing protein n=1 Tax=Sanguibacter inulinus TaxID=60922 RepID=A0A853EUF0_9MICO|nr:YhgE/Pip domain-containing protein [Sanguibacter inulinus]MBF0722976.1 YhgE/Pip domain-containing protein [Sanguibacter inulinus]NYS94121.1 YhgE/Pip domain-containing protein [Sanguibacter inulinus]
MKAVRISLSELRRISAGTLPKLAIAAFAIIPTLYAGLYLFVNSDPYSRLDQVPAALVVEDTGEFGQKVADNLLDDGGFGWVETSRAEAQVGVRSGEYDAALVIGPTFSDDLASSGEFAPQQASITLVTNDANNYLARTIADQIVGKVRDSIASEVGTEAAAQFLAGFSDIRTSLEDAVSGATELTDGTAQLVTGSDQLVTGSADLATGASTAATGASDLATGASTLKTGAATLATGASTLKTGIDDLDTGLGTLKTATTDLPTQAQALADGAKKVADGNATIAGYGDAAATGAQTLVDDLDTIRTGIADDLRAQGLTEEEITTVLTALDTARQPITDASTALGEVSTSLDTLSSGATQVSDGAAALALSAPTLAQGIADAATGADSLATGASTLSTGASDLSTGASELSTGADSLKTGTATLSEGASTLATGVSTLHDGIVAADTGAVQLRDGLTSGMGEVPDVDAQTQDDTAQTIGNPVVVQNESLTSAGTYGAGLAPFFLSLASWIGAYVLFLLVKPLSRRALAAGRSLWSSVATALGGWLTPAAIGVAQAALMFTVTKFALDIQPAYPWFTALFLVLVSATFVAILQALNAWLGAAGQFLGLVLMLTQLVTAGGTFPWQTIPEPLRSLHQFLPMSYGVDGLRHLLYGGSLTNVGTDAAVLALFLVGSLAVTTLAARKQRLWTVRTLQPELVL